MTDHLIRLRANYRFARAILRLHLDWWSLQSFCAKNARKEAFGPRKLLIMPAAMAAPMGSRGDQAMIYSVLDYYRSLNPGVEVHIVTSTGLDDDEIRAAGMSPILVGDKQRFLCTLIRWVVPHFDACVIVGADCMDGYYSSISSTNFVAVTDLLTRANIDTRVLGFSFNSNPSLVLKLAYWRLANAVTLRLRDRVSLENFRQFSAHKNLACVADAAFNLSPNFEFPAYQAIGAWCREQRSRGRLVIALNVNGMLLSRFDFGVRREWFAAFCLSMSQMIKDRNLSFILLAHDNRGECNDNIILGEMFSELGEHERKNVLWTSVVYSANQVKAIVGLCDAAISGRMHLAIAALGQGVPVFCFSYQDKFEGLRRYFDLPSEHFLEFETFRPQDLPASVDAFVSELDELKTVVTHNLPLVLELARKNFE